jgi:hypothetical protein
MTLTGKDALDVLQQIKEKNERARSEAFANAKDAARAAGKEPFDLAKLEKLCALDALGPMTPEERDPGLEYRYYVHYPNVMTVAEFAAKLDELGHW